MTAKRAGCLGVRNRRESGIRAPKIRVRNIPPIPEAIMSLISRRLFPACLSVLASLLPAAAQQANVNLDWNPQKNTQNLVPYGANVISPEVRDDGTVTFRIRAPRAQ